MFVWGAREGCSNINVVSSSRREGEGRRGVVRDPPLGEGVLDLPPVLRTQVICQVKSSHLWCFSGGDTAPTLSILTAVP